MQHMASIAIALDDVRENDHLLLLLRTKSDGDGPSIVLIPNRGQ